MPDMQKVLQIKERILEVVRQRGPELPVRIANTIGVNNLFTAAFMSELVGEQKLKISHMRVGSSPLYYIIGQEEQLQKYTDYLNHKEKEAFKTLKENKILNEEELEPAIRVALKNIKDFAIPLQITNNAQTKVFWKIHTLSNDEAKNIIESKLNPKIQKVEEKIIQKEEIKEEVIEEKTPLAKKVDDNLDIFESPKEKIVKKQITKEISSHFLTNIKAILEEKKFEVLTELLVKKKEYSAKIRAETHLGKQEFYLVAKEKKKITADDLSLALQKAQAEKMPALIFSTGEIDKKAKEYYTEWRNLIKHEKINA
ncbi:MAG: hypothetical protein ACP5NS_01870 [Candidatus Pacearchaeota archaeon]